MTYSVSLENWVLDQLVIPLWILFFALSYLLDIVMINPEEKFYRGHSWGLKIL